MNKSIKNDPKDEFSADELQALCRFIEDALKRWVSGAGALALVMEGRDE